MSIDFTKLQGLEIPEGVVTQIEDASGRVIWMVANGEPIVLEVQKITSNTYAGSTTYENEEFILLDIYPKTNGTVSVTYGGLTKTIKDTSGAEEPNAIQVFFGTFNGVSDEVETPASGTMVIKGDYIGVGVGTYEESKGVTRTYGKMITEVYSLGDSIIIPNNAFDSSVLDNEYASHMTSVEIPDSVTSIEGYAFSGCLYLRSVNLGKGLVSIGKYAFSSCSSLTSITIPSSVTSIGDGAFYGCSALTSVIFENTSGWYHTETEGGDISTGESLNVKDPLKNAEWITGVNVVTNKLGYWYRTE